LISNLITKTVVTNIKIQCRILCWNSDLVIDQKEDFRLHHCEDVSTTGKNSI